MPCDQIVMNRVEFREGTDLKMLAAALKAAGYSVAEYDSYLYFSHREMSGTGTFQAGVFTVPRGWNMDTAKHQYAKLSVEATAKKMGWTVKYDVKNPAKMQIRRRA